MLRGDPLSLGAQWDGEGINFALFSAAAERVELSLFRNGTEIERVDMPGHENQIWHGYLPKSKLAEPGLQYGYRVSGEWNPEQGLYFNSDNILLDPYARALSTPLRQAGDRERLPLGVVTAPLDDISDRIIRPATPWNSTIIYEMHVKGFSQQHPEIAKSMRGKFCALTAPPLLDHIKSLGITAVELLPVFAFGDEPHLAPHSLSNYWGYNSINFFSPDPRYLTNPTAIEEFRSMVRAYHDAGIEVILDVVYNHTAEGGADGAIISYRGIDNQSYYRTNPNCPVENHNESGCGNTLDFSHPKVVQLVMDSLRYWAEEMEVDGFRFDLASTLGRTTENTFSPTAPLFSAINQDPTLNKLKLIAEPWDLGINGYQTGNFPMGWSEWNDHYRDDIRRFWQGDDQNLGDLGQRLTGSADLFNHHGRTPQASINFITAHDGFTLNDLVSYEQKHNLDNKEDNRDGNNNNISWNRGVEGESSDLEIIERRNIDRRNLLTTLLFSQGVPMLLSGDEIDNTQWGNNNSYCQDNPISWLDWKSTTQDEIAPKNNPHNIYSFVRKLIEIRQSIPYFSHHCFHPTPNQSSTKKVISWFTPQNIKMESDDWQHSASRSLIMHCFMHCCSLDEHSDAPVESAILLLINGSLEQRTFTIPDISYGKSWRLQVDTALTDRGNSRVTELHHSTELELSAQSIVVLQQIA